MSMHEIVHGRNPLSAIYLGALDLTSAEVGRFRDAWLTEDGKVAIYTRNGGGNRECYEEKSGPDCDCTGCIATYRLPKHPLYLRDADDDFDSTYATFFFSMPESLKGVASALAEKRNPDAEWLKALDALRKGQRPDIEAALKPVVEAILDGLA